MSPPKHEASLERWLSVALRTAHLAGVVWVGAAVVAGQAVDPRATVLLAGSGIALLLTDLRAGRIALGEMAGALVLVKVALLVWMVLDPRQAGWIFWSLLVASAVSSHAPKGWRHWPRSRQVRASSTSKPG
ncbi:MAG: hypothetical protein MUF08_07660 [Burkholderiaceae bacterium]|nr:hypothetical protein [Burkholderiaceae bacterium]MCU0964921.1 hypothetical protein [Burkholderiaceae bacterium]